MATFSTSPTDANLLSGILDVVSVIEDNTQKAISPKDLRDGFYTLWENTIFKPTTITGSTIKYIGVDQYQLQDISDTNIYPKVYFGKKQVLGSFIMSSGLLDNAVDNIDKIDYFFYNMKNSSLYGSDTAISILAGTQSFQRNDGKILAPVLKSTVVSTSYGNYINFNISNYSSVSTGATYYGGDINILSDKGYVSFNNFLFPKQSEITSDKDGYVLKYKWSAGQAYGYWESAFSQSITSINYPQGQVTITGNPIVLNGYRFTDANIVATGIGGIRAGETFSDVDVLDVLRRIIYTYVPPQVTTKITLASTGSEVVYIESGTNPNTLRLNWTVRVNSTYSVPVNSIIVNPSVTGTLPTTPLTSTSNIGTLTPNLSPLEYNVTLPKPYNIINYTFSVKDTNPNGRTQSSSSTLKIVLPYFYGTSQNFATTSNGQPNDPNNINSLLGTSENAPINKLNRILVEPIIGTPTYSNNQNLFITTKGLGLDPDGIGYIYFGYPSYYPLLKEIVDSNGLVVTSRFTTYSINITDLPPSSKWSSIPYIFYITGETRVPFSPIPYQFLFATQS
jgi:hypothetical protein